MPCRFSNDLFALKKCCILHIEQFNKQKKKKTQTKTKTKKKSKKKTKQKKTNSGIKLLMSIVLIS